MRGVCVVALATGGVGEFHDAAQFVTFAARGFVEANMCFEDFGNVVLQGANGNDDFVFLGFGDFGFKAKREHVNVHGSLGFGSATLRSPFSFHSMRRSFEYDSRA